VFLLHGDCDVDVPLQVARDLATKLQAPEVNLQIVQGGDHRLSEPSDLDLLVATVARIVKND
jgi:dipeptidyl aminopeptidase/acylaminoacyl peptidase